MASVIDSGQRFERIVGERSVWLPVLAGFAVMYIPTFYDLSHGMWTRDEYLHGPIVLAVSAWLLWHLWGGLARIETRPAPAWGWACIVIGVPFYVLGRSQQIILFEVGSQIPMLLGTFLLLQGWRAARHMWFPIFFLAFMVPLPGFIVDALTNPLKQQVSVIAEDLVYWAGFPIARSGVVLVIGPYQLLVADACSGLHSLISMSAMGLLYVFLSRHTSVARSAILVASLLPIAFASNVVRVVVLVLVTYFLGDEAGQGFIHGFSGVFLFAVGLLLLFLIDYLLGLVPALRDRGGHNEARG